MVTIRHAQQGDVAASVAVLMAAFFPDPVSVWLVPDGEVRRRFHRGLFQAAFEDSHDAGELRVAEDGGEVAGVAVWYPPGRVRDPSGPAMDDALAALDDTDLDRLGALREAMAEHEPVQAHFYLWLMAVAHDRRGAGIGGSLISVVLDVADEHETLAYLEATRPENRRLYERYGFKATGGIRLPDGPTVWPMLRTPQA